MKDYRVSSQVQWQRYLSLQQGEQAFTLIELLLVTLIVVILSAISLPNLMNQIGKARETEAKTQLGSLLRSQEAFHIEHQEFADSLDKLAPTGSFNSKYYTYDINPIDIATQVNYKATSSDAIRDRVRNYAAGVYFDAGIYTIIICQSDKINGSVDVLNTPSGTCTGGTSLK